MCSKEDAVMMPFVFGQSKETNKNDMRNERKRKLDTQEQVMEMLNKTFVDDKKIEISLIEWTKMSTLLITAQAEIETLKEEIKMKDTTIKEQLQFMSNMNKTLELSTSIIQQHSKENSTKSSEQTNEKETKSNELKNDNGTSNKGKSDKKTESNEHGKENESRNNENIVTPLAMNEIQLSNGMIVKRSSLEPIRNNTKLNASRLVRQIVPLIFSEEELLHQSITGKKCNFNTGKNVNEALESLDPQKVQAMKDELRFILTSRNYSAKDVEAEIAETDNYIRRKISSVKNAHRKALRKSIQNGKTSLTNNLNSPQTIARQFCPTSTNLLTPMTVINLNNRLSGDFEYLHSENSNDSIVEIEEKYSESLQNRNSLGTSDASILMDSRASSSSNTMHNLPSNRLPFSRNSREMSDMVVENFNSNDPLILDSFVNSSDGSLTSKTSEFDDEHLP